MYRQYLKKFLTRAEQVEKQKEASDGMKWCNFKCQDFLPLESFPKSATNCCSSCRNVLSLGKKYISDGRITEEEFRENLDIVYEKLDVPTDEKEIVCVKCKTKKSKQRFDVNRNVCRECRIDHKNKKVEDEFESTLQKIEECENNSDKIRYLLDRTSVLLIKRLATHYKVGRRSTDNKNDLIVKLVNHFKQLQSPYMCTGGCNFNLPTQFSCCDKCKIKDTTISIAERNLLFKENLPTFMETLYEIPTDIGAIHGSEYNIYNIHDIAKYVGINSVKTYTKSVLIDMINEKLKPKRDERDSQDAPVVKKDLELNGIILVSRDDGFINATQLCKAGNKKFNDWKRIEASQELIQALESNTGIPALNLIDSKVGGNHSGSWIHPDLAVQLAQWISPLFALQVSRWIRELALTGSVSVRNQKSKQELDELQKQYNNLDKKHTGLLKRRTYHTFKRGPSFYIISDLDSGKKKFKVGIDMVNVNVRFQQHRTSIPAMDVEYLLYSDNCDLIEKCILKRYEDKLEHKNHEWIYDIDVDHIISSVKTLCAFLDIKYTEESVIE